MDKNLVFPMGHGTLTFYELDDDNDIGIDAPGDQYSIYYINAEQIQQLIDFLQQQLSKVNDTTTNK